LHDEETTHRIPSLSPMSVATDFQRRGVGSALIRAVVARVDEAGEPMVVLEGAPAYYGRLGFEYAVPHGIHITLPEWAPPEAAQQLTAASRGVRADRLAYTTPGRAPT
jgi:putative acetyltransferase